MLGFFSTLTISVTNFRHTWQNAIRQRVLKNESPEGPFLQAFHEHLTDVYQFWGRMEFINGRLLEEVVIWNSPIRRIPGHPFCVQRQGVLYHMYL